MKQAELSTKQPAELVKVVADTRQALAKLQIELASKEAVSTARRRELKKTIARALTLLRQQELKASGGNND